MLLLMPHLHIHPSAVDLHEHGHECEERKKTVLLRRGSSCDANPSPRHLSVRY